MNCIEVLQAKVDELFKEKAIPEKTYQVMEAFVKSYVETALMGGLSESEVIRLFELYMGRLRHLHYNPFSFDPYHEQILKPFDYFQFGLDFIRPLVNLKESALKGEDALEDIQKKIDRNENVILLANHQTEIDPHLINFLLEKKHPKLAKEMIFVAGDRVILDHLAVPASMGRNLLCIFSKKHINNPPEKMAEKMAHNRRTMQRMADLLQEGGKCIYVAPSGGRDRPDEDGEFPVAPLDPQSIEMFYLMAQKKAKLPCHFHTLALLTYKVLPPPNDVEMELGEQRSTSYSGIYAYFGKEINMELFSGKKIPNKVEMRESRAKFVWNQINTHYQVLKKLKDQYEAD